MPIGTPHGMLVPGIGSLRRPNIELVTPVNMSTRLTSENDQVADHGDQEDLGRALRRADLAAREQREGDADDAERAEDGHRHDAVAEELARTRR